MNKTNILLLLKVITSILPSGTHAGPLSYGICQTGCNIVTVACYSAAGFTFGTITGGIGAPPVIIACNVALGGCMTACVAAGCAPIP